jgi:hypothetical protein
MDNSECMPSVLQIYETAYTEDDAIAFWKTYTDDENRGTERWEPPYCKGNICKIVGFNLGGRLNSYFYNPPLESNSTCCAAAQVMSSWFHFETVGRSFWNPYLIRSETDTCVSGDDVLELGCDLDGKPTRASFARAKELMCGIPGCSGFISDVLMSWAQLHNRNSQNRADVARRVFEPLYARNNLDMGTLCLFEHGYETCEVGYFVFLAPVVAASEEEERTSTSTSTSSGMSCCDASEVVLRELRWQGIDVPLGKQRSSVDLAELAMAKEVMRYDAMCKAAFEATLDLQREFEISVYSDVTNFNYFTLPSQDAAETFLAPESEMCWIPFALDDPLTDISPMYCAAASVVVSRGLWQHYANCSGIFRFVPIGKRTSGCFLCGQQPSRR